MKMITTLSTKQSSIPLQGQTPTEVTYKDEVEQTFPRTLIIVPAYNEAESLGRVIDNIRANIAWADIAVINDGSADATAEIARQKRVNLLNLPYNLGIGGAVQTGYKFAAKRGYQVAVQVDGDGQHPANQIEQLITTLVNTKANVVIGSRFVGDSSYQAPLSRLIGIRILATVISILARQRLTDTTSGFRAVDRQAINFLAQMYPRDYPEPETIVFLRREGFQIVEIPVVMQQRLGGISSITSIKGLYYMIKVLLAIFIDMFEAPAWKGEL